MKVRNFQNHTDLVTAFEQWHKLLFRYIYARTKNRELAEDLTQEVFIKAWKGLDSYDCVKSSLKSWLFTITKNLLRDHARKKTIIPFTLDPILEESIPDDMDIVEHFDQKNRVAFVYKKMLKLKSKEQQLLYLRYKEDKSIDEISELMGMKYSAAKVSLHRALKKLQNLCKYES